MSFSVRNNIPPFSAAALRTIAGAAAVGGTLDLLGAFAVYGRIAGDITPVYLLQSLASVLIGGAAFKGGETTASLGLILHYALVFGFSLVYFIWFPFVPFFRRQRICGGLLYGMFIWILSTTAVLPIAHSVTLLPHFENVTWSFLSVQILLGLPITIVIRDYYKARQRSYLV